MSKNSKQWQEKFRGNQFFNDSIYDGISSSVKLHDEIMNPLSSAAACLNVLGYLNQNPKSIIPFFKSFGLSIESVIEFPKDVNLGGEVYDDKGPIIFEWIGSKKSPINEKGGSRGQNRTSIDAFFIAKVNGKISQIFIEWKFTENYNSDKYLHKFGGLKGIERLRRYTSVLAEQRNKKFPFKFEEEDVFGICDFSYEPLYQLLRMTLLAKESTPMKFGNLAIEDYYILHLVHSENKDLLSVTSSQLRYSPGIKIEDNIDLHELWMSLLSDEEKKHFYFGYWNIALPILKDSSQYLENRYM